MKRDVIRAAITVVSMKSHSGSAAHRFEQAQLLLWKTLLSEWLSHWLSEKCIASNRILFAEIKSDGGEHFPAGWETPQARLSDLMCYKWTVKSSLMHVVGHRAHQPHPFTSYCQKDLDCQSTRLFGWAGCLSSLVQSDRIVTASCHLSLI